MTLRLLVLALGTLLLAAPTALAQAPADGPAAAATPAAVSTAPAPAAPAPVAVQQATSTWMDAWRETPRLLSLVAEEGTHEDLDEQLRGRLTLLGEKTFSNREWKGYWTQQGATAGALAEALRASSGDAAQLAALDAWVELAQDKVLNQDRYFEAIESERDAVEDRLEASLEAKTEPDEPRPAITDPNPYEERKLKLEDLERRITVQEGRRTAVAAEIAYIERQLRSEAILAEALAKDLSLAKREVAIARAEAARPGAWGLLWAEVAEATSDKVDKIALESEYGAARERSRQVELGLARSQINFRDKRLAELQDKRDEAGSMSTWASATWDTILDWLRHKAWRIAIGLLLLAFCVRLSLRLTNHTARIILERTDDDPDSDDDGDQRRQTLADVFVSVTRIAVYIVGGLLALEQIGINTGPLLGSVAILGLAISFGSQNLVRDVVNGFFILLENQFAVGDVVTVNDKTGTVELISLRSTWVRSATGDLHVMPNGSIGVVSNLTRGWSRAVCEIGVGYDADLGQVREVINRVGEEMYVEPEWAEHLEEAPQWVGVTQLGDSAVTVRTQVKVAAGQQWSVHRELNRRLKIAFDDAGIEIPYPQSVVHRRD